MSRKNCRQRTGLCAGMGLEKRPPEPLLIEKQMYKISFKSSAMFVKPELKLIANYSRSLQRPAMLAQNPMLAAVLLPCIIEFKQFVFGLSK